MKRWASLAAITLGLAACQDASGPVSELRPTAPLAISAAKNVPIPGDYIVTLRDDAGDIAAIAQSIAGLHKGQLKHIYKTALKGFAVHNISEAAAAAIASDPRVERVEADQVMTALTDQPNATWGIDRVDQRNLPLSTTYENNDVDGTGVTAYIIDTGILLGHDEFGGRAVKGFDAVTAGGTAVDCNGHGTHVAGTVGGKTYGIAKNVTLVAVRVLGCTGSGTTSGVIAGINWVTDNHAAGAPAVANMSLGGGASTALDNAVINSINDGVTYGVAAGNSNANACLSSPARAGPALTVGSTTSTDARSSFSNFGTCVDIFAPGSGITSAWYTSQTATNTISGTSMATPHVVGAAALYLQKNPAATPAIVESALEGKATPGKVTSPGAGSPNLLLYSAFIGGQPEPPVAEFTWSCNLLACNFTSTSSADAATATYDWDWGDLTAHGFVATPSHTFASPGNKTVTLIVADTYGTSQPTSHTFVVASGSVASFTKSCSGRTCTFNASSSTNATSYAWNFGDGSTATGVTRSHRFARNRSYTVTLTTQPGNSTAQLPVTCTSSCK